jgi:hypothetical protein
MRRCTIDTPNTNGVWVSSAGSIPHIPCGGFVLGLYYLYESEEGDEGCKSITEAQPHTP